MISTNELRFVEREIRNIQEYLGEDIVHVTVTRVLQQKWKGLKRTGEYPLTQADINYVEEWIDVPVEKEQL